MNANDNNLIIAGAEASFGALALFLHRVDNRMTVAEDQIEAVLLRSAVNPATDQTPTEELLEHECQQRTALQEALESKITVLQETLGAKLLALEEHVDEIETDADARLDELEHDTGGEEEWAERDHDHDEQYADASHNHEDEYIEQHSFEEAVELSGAVTGLRREVDELREMLGVETRINAALSTKIALLRESVEPLLAFVAALKAVISK